MGNPKDEKLYIRLVEHATTHYRVTLLANLLNSFILIYILRNVVPHSRLAIWFVVLIAIVAIRAIHAHNARFVTYSQARKIERINFFSLALTGTIWGMVSLFLFPANTLAHQTFIAFVIGGMVIGASVTTAALSNTFLAFSIPALIPLISRFFAIGTEITHAMGLMLIVFFFCFAFISRELQLLIIQTIKFTLEKEKEIKVRENVEKELRRHQESLELIVRERTEDISKSNRLLVGEIAERKQAEVKGKELIAKLQKALDEIKTLRGIIPICSYCKKIKSEKGIWDQLEIYIEEHSDADFSHGMCPDCYKIQLEKFKKDKAARKQN